MAIQVCERCGCEFDGRPAARRRYCGVDCYRAAHAPVECHCGACGKHFTKPPSQVRGGAGKYCSRACSTVAHRQRNGETAPHWRGGQVDCTCQTCGKAFSVDLNRVKAGRGKHCSKECYWQRARGPEHWKYRDGRGQAPYTGGYTPRIRRLVIERDKVCVDCGEWDDRPRRMQVHHLDGGKDDHSLENLALLCLKCHVARHAYSSGQSASGVVASAAAILT